MKVTHVVRASVEISMNAKNGSRATTREDENIKSTESIKIEASRDDEIQFVQKERCMG